jgi:putative membrane protein
LNQNNDRVKPDANTEMAKMRTRDAAERTLMAWIRTSLYLITFGFGIDQITQAIAGTRIQTGPDVIMNVRVFGLVFIFLGIMGLILAIITHWYDIKGVQKTEYIYKPPVPAALIIGVAIAVIGILAFIEILLRIR